MFPRSIKVQAFRYNTPACSENDVIFNSGYGSTRPTSFDNGCGEDDTFIVVPFDSIQNRKNTPCRSINAETVAVESPQSSQREWTVVNHVQHFPSR